MELQDVAERWVKLAARAPHRANPEKVATEELGFDEYPDWVRNLETKNVRNGALVAVDYVTGETIAYVGSADYYSTRGNKQVPAAVRRRRPGLPATGIRVQAVQLRGRHR